MRAFFRRDISDFIGNRSRDLFDSGEEIDREDKERRALVFGSEETALCFDPTGSDRSRVQIESFSPSQDRFYVFGMFLDLASCAFAFVLGSGRPRYSGQRRR